MVMHKPKNKLFLTDSYKSSLISALNEEYPETGMEYGVDNTGRKPYEWEFNPTFTSIRKAVERETYNSNPTPMSNNASSNSRTTD